jgi:hypothetical protein
VVIAPLFVAACAATFSTPGSRGAGRVAVAIAVSLALGLGVAIWPQRPSGASSRVRRTIDLLSVLLVCLVVFQLTPLNFSRVTNMAYFLGPTNDVLHGQPMLVDTFSQYGVAMYYALAASFSVLPLGFGVFTLILSTGTALLFAVIYATLRLSIRSQAIAVVAIATAVFVYIYAGLWQYVDYPSTGALRFGPAWLVVLLGVATSRTSGRRAKLVLRRSILALVGLAAIWSAEVGVYCMGAAAAMAVLDCAAADEPIAQRTLAATRRITALLVSAVVGCCSS